jgi:hypothetical protein
VERVVDSRGGMRSGRPSGLGRSRTILVALLILAASIGASSAVRFPIVDDEATVTTNASGDLSRILRAGLGRDDQFHPPLFEIVLHSWLVTTGSMRAAVVRVPGAVFWVAALASLFWALLPIAPRGACLGAVAATTLWPAHFLLPYSANWYSLAALFSVLSFGALLRALSATSARRVRLAWTGFVAAIVALAYTSFVWPFMVAAQLTAAALILGVAPLRRHARSLFGVGVVVALAVSPTMMAIFVRVGPMLHRQASGGPAQSVGAILALLVGHSAPARAWIASFVILAVAGLAIGMVGADRRVWSTIAIGMISLGCLAATNTLNDKRLLVGSMFLPAGLGLRIGERRGQLALGACALAAVPAWLGWAAVTQLQWLFPRWQDPVDELVSLHISTPKPRLLITNEPAIAFAVARTDGEKQMWQLSSDDPTKTASLRWLPWRPDMLLAAVRDRDHYAGPSVRTIDLILSTKLKNREIEIRDIFQSAGWRVVDDRSFGEDPLSQFRHPGGGSARIHFIHLDRGGTVP